MRRLALTATLLVLVACEKKADSVGPALTPSAPISEGDPDDRSKSTRPTVSSPPPLSKPPSQDTARYVAWMEGRGTPLRDTPTENVALRIGEWGFFSHGAGPGQSLDRTALDRSKHWIQRGDQGDWYALLTTKGLDAPGALERVAWLYSAVPIAGDDPERAPTLTVETASATFEGWLLFPPNTSQPRRITIVATKSGTKITTEPASR